MAAKATIPNLAELSSQFRTLADMAGKLADQIDMAVGERSKPAPRGAIAKIIKDVADEFGVLPSEIRGTDRSRHLVWPRQEAMRRAHEAGFSYPQIGHVLNRDHTTVIHGARAAEMRARG